MGAQRFHAVITVGPRGAGLIAVPFDPDAEWGAKGDHPVGGSIGDRRVRGRLTRRDGGWELTVTPLWLRDTATAVGDEVAVVLNPEGPQRADLAEDVAAALEADQAAGAFFDTLAQFYRKGYLRWIDATRGRQDVRAARIAEVTGLLAAGVKQRPRP